MILSKWKKYYEASEESIFQRDGWDSNFHVSYPRKLGEKTRGGRVSNVDFFFFRWKPMKRFSRGWSSLIEALDIKAERVETADRFAEEIALNLRRLPRFSYSNSIEDLIHTHTHIYFVSSIHSNCRLLTNLAYWMFDPFKSR